MNSLKYLSVNHLSAYQKSIINIPLCIPHTLNIRGMLDRSIQALTLTFMSAALSLNICFSPPDLSLPISPYRFTVGQSLVGLNFPSLYHRLQRHPRFHITIHNSRVCKTWELSFSPAVGPRGFSHFLSSYHS